MKLISIPYSFSIVDVDIFFYKVGQTLQSLTLIKSYMQTKKKRREYNKNGAEFLFGFFGCRIIIGVLREGIPK